MLSDFAVRIFGNRCMCLFVNPGTPLVRPKGVKFVSVQAENDLEPRDLPTIPEFQHHRSGKRSSVSNTPNVSTVSLEAVVTDVAEYNVIIRGYSQSSWGFLHSKPKEAIVTYSGSAKGDYPRWSHSDSRQSH